MFSFVLGGEKMKLNIITLLFSFVLAGKRPLFLFVRSFPTDARSPWPSGAESCWRSHGLLEVLEFVCRSPSSAAKTCKKCQTMPPKARFFGGKRWEMAQGPFFKGRTGGRRRSIEYAYGKDGFLGICW